MRGFYPVARKPYNSKQPVKLNQPPTKKVEPPVQSVPVVANEQKQEAIDEIIEIIPLKKPESIKKEFEESRQEIQEDVEQIKELRSEIKKHKQEIEEEKKELAEKVPLTELSRFELMKMAKEMGIKVIPSDKKEDLILKIKEKEEK